MSSGKQQVVAAIADSGGREQFRRPLRIPLEVLHAAGHLATAPFNSVSPFSRRTVALVAAPQLKQMSHEGRSVSASPLDPVLLLYTFIPISVLAVQVSACAYLLF